jgi:biotin operon repressor
MRYRRSRDIEQRLSELVRLLRSGRQSTATLTAALSISRPTVTRDIGALRERGYFIRAVKNAEGWTYELIAEPAAVTQGSGVNQT